MPLTWALCLLCFVSLWKMPQPSCVWELRKTSWELIANLSTETSAPSRWISVKYHNQRQLGKGAAKEHAPEAAGPLLRRWGSSLPSCSPYADSCSHTQIHSKTGRQAFFQAPSTTWLAWHNSLTMCATSDLFALEKSPHVCHHHR